MEFLDRLVESRARAWNEASELVERAATENRDLTAEEQEKFDRIGADLDAKDTEIRSWTERLERDAENDKARSEWSQILKTDHVERSLEAEVDEFSRFIRGESQQRSWDLDFRAIAAERQAVRAGATGQDFRDLVKVTTTAGGNLVPTSFLRQLYDFLEVYSGVRQLGVTILTTSSGENLEVPTVTAHGTAAIVGEGTALAEADAAFGKITLGSYKYGQLVQVSSELLADTGVDILGFLARDLGRALGRATDTAYVTGSGTNAPEGLATTLGTGATAQTGATGLPSYANLVDLVYSVNQEYRQNAQWFMKDATLGSIRKLVDTTNRPLWEPSLQLGAPDRLMGFPVVTDPNVAALGTASTKPIMFGDFSGFYIRDVGTIRVERSDEFAFSQDLVSWRAVMRTDSKLVDKTGCAKLLLEPTT